MTISVAMNSGLGFLQDINSSMTDVQKRLSTGQKDLGVVQLLTVSDFQNRISSLNTVNEGILTAVSQIKAASTSLSSIRTNLSDTLNSLRDARTSAAAVVSGTTQPDTPSATGASFSISVAGKNGGTFNGNSLLTNVTINGAQLALGNTLAIAVGGKSINIKVASAADAAVGSPTDIANKLQALNTATTAVTTAQTKLTNDQATQVTNKTAADQTVYTGGVQNVVANALVAGAKAYYGTTNGSAASVTQSQLADFVYRVSTGVIDLNAGTDSSGGSSVSMATVSAAMKAADNANYGTAAQQTTAIKNSVNTLKTSSATFNTYYTMLGTLTTDNNNVTTATATQTAAQTVYNTALSNQQTGDANHPYLVATVQDYMSALQKLNDVTDQKRMNFDNPVPLTGNLTTFSANGTSDADISITTSLDSITVGNLFAKKYDSATPADTTNAYETEQWSINGNTSTLSQTHHTGTGAGQTTTPADPKRAVAANALRSFMDQMTQFVKDARLNGVNVLAGDNINTNINADGDKFSFQLSDSNGNAQSLSDALKLNLADYNLVAGGTNSAGTTSTNNNFNNNTDLDKAIADMTTALGTTDVITSNVSAALTGIQSRSDFNTSLVSIMNDAVTGIQSSDSTADAAELSSLQTRQQFANSILSIIKQGDQNPLQLLR